MYLFNTYLVTLLEFITITFFLCYADLTLKLERHTAGETKIKPNKTFTAKYDNGHYICARMTLDSYDKYLLLHF